VDVRDLAVFTAFARRSAEPKIATTFQNRFMSSPCGVVALVRSIGFLTVTTQGRELWDRWHLALGTRPFGPGELRLCAVR
jgi:hypothetical protein